MNNLNNTTKDSMIEQRGEKEEIEVWLPESPTSECIVEQDWKDYDYHHQIPLFLSNQSCMESLQERITEFVNKE